MTEKIANIPKISKSIEINPKRGFYTPDAHCIKLWSNIVRLTCIINFIYVSIWHSDHLSKIFKKHLEDAFVHHLRILTVSALFSLVIFYAKMRGLFESKFLTSTFLLIGLWGIAKDIRKLKSYAFRAFYGMYLFFFPAIKYYEFIMLDISEIAHFSSGIISFIRFTFAPVATFNEYMLLLEKQYAISKAVSSLPIFILGIIESTNFIFINEYVDSSILYLMSDNFKNYASKIVIAKFLVYMLSIITLLHLTLDCLFLTTVQFLVTITQIKAPVFMLDLDKITNVKQFWQQWNVELHTWVKKNLYYPLLNCTRRKKLSLIFSFFIMGLLHDAALWIYSKQSFSLNYTILVLLNVIVMRCQTRHFAYLNLAYFTLAAAYIFRIRPQ